MSDLRRPALRTTIGRVAVAGAATLASVFAVAPVAFADDVAPASEPTDAPVTPEPSESTETPAAPVEETPGTPTEETPAVPTAPDVTGENGKADDAPKITSKADVAAAAVVGDFGSQKFRVGVQIDDGSWVPEGTTTVGSTFRISTTDADGNVTVTTCTTTEDNYDENTGQSFCDGNIRFLPSLLRAASPPEVTEDDKPIYDEDTTFQRFVLAPGSSATITQTVAAPGLTKSSDSVTIEPCKTDEDSYDDLGFPFPSGPLCSPSDDELTPVKTTKVVFNNTGPLPVARADKASTTEGKAVKIDVLDNDDSDDPTTKLKVSSSPDDGKAVVVGSAADVPDPEPTASPSPSSSPSPTDTATLSAVEGAGTLAIRYTPRAGFSGTDRFQYAVSNTNGSDTATVTVTVKDGAVSDASVSDGDDALLPDTGGADPKLLGFAGLLLAGGGWLTLRGRRRTADASID